MKKYNNKNYTRSSKSSKTGIGIAITQLTRVKNKNNDKNKNPTDTNKNHATMIHRHTDRAEHHRQNIDAQPHKKRNVLNTI